MKKILLTAFLLLTLVIASSAYAQDSTPEITPEITPEVTPEATLESTAESTPDVDVTPESTLEVSVEATDEAEATPGVDATPEATSPVMQGQFDGAGSYTVRQPYSDVERSYRVYIPESYDETGAGTALVIVMHGASGTGAGTESFVGFNDLADEEGFIVAYPDGVNNVWNDGRFGDPRIGEVDDLRFLSDIVDVITTELNVDPDRVYAAGFSMGGMMSFRAGCELPDLFAAIGSVASTMPMYLISACNNAPPIPVIVFQGTDDPVIGWTGISGAYLSAAQTLGYWGGHNQCTPTVTLERMPDGDIEDYTAVIRQELVGCEADVTVYGIYFGGHTWPGHPINATQLGSTSRDIDATALLWEFFKDHPKVSE